MSDYHEPVMLHTSIDALVNDPGGIYVDVTFGGGGHSREILKRLNKDGVLFALDQDEDAIRQVVRDPRLVLIHGNFRFLGNFLRYHGIKKVDGILADLGVSSFQLDEESKGFSFQSDAHLDMRMNRRGKINAGDIINNEKEEDLVKLFSQYGEVRNAKSLAKTILAFRRKRPIHSIQELLLCIEPLIIGNRSRYLAQVFQAIRIKVNDELGALKSLLISSGHFLQVGGKVVVLTYHSIEDRMVKHFMKRGTFASTTEVAQDFYGRNRPWCLKMTTKKPILPTDEEIRLNRRARSAKMRVAEKIRDEEGPI